MTVIEIVKELIIKRGFTKSGLAKKMGYSTPSGITEILRRKGMNIDTLVKLLGAMDCELIIKSKLKDKSEWTVGGDL